MERVLEQREIGAEAVMAETDLEQSLITELHKENIECGPDLLFHASSSESRLRWLVQG